MKTRILSFLLVGAVAALVTSVVTAQDAPSDPKSAPWAPVAQPGAPPPLALAVPSPPGEPVPPAASKESDKLEDIIAEVVKSSPDVQVAEAQLREAEAKLRQAQMQAVQKATEVYQKRMLAEKAADSAKVLLDNVQEQQKIGRATDEQVLSTQQSLAEAQAEIARYGTELQSMLGAGLKALRSTLSPSGALFAERSLRQPRPTLDSIKNEELKARLDMPLSIEFEKVDLLAIKDYLVEYSELNMAIDPELAESGTGVSIRLQDVPLKDILLALADSFDNACFLVRDYGIFATTRDKAQQIAAPCIPDTVPLYVPATATQKSPDPVKEESKDLTQIR